MMWKLNRDLQRVILKNRKWTKGEENYGMYNTGSRNKKSKRNGVFE